MVYRLLLTRQGTHVDLLDAEKDPSAGWRSSASVGAYPARREQRKPVRPLTYPIATRRSKNRRRLGAMSAHLERRKQMTRLSSALFGSRPRIASIVSAVAIAASLAVGGHALADSKG